LSWKDLLGDTGVVVAPWIGGRTIHRGGRAWTIDGGLPEEHGWFRFRTTSRKATCESAAEAEPDVLFGRTPGYLVGDRFVQEAARVDPDPSRIAQAAPRIHLIEPGLERFARVSGGTAFEGGPWIYAGQEMPLGPEAEVALAYEDRRASVLDVRAVPPALDAAFRMETWRREEAARRRAELERRRREAEEERARQERRKELVERLGDGAGRREMARVDFGEAARSALAIGGAEYLDHRRARARGEMVVRFRFLGRRFECTTDEALHIVDAGICLTDHETGERGDGYFTLESLPSVIREAEDQGALVVFRHVEGQ
jgi:hypothetical protein